MTTRPFAALALAVALQACASDAPKVAPDATTASIAIEALGAGFVKLDGERLPLEAAVLQLRWRFRGMARSEREQVEVRVTAASGGDAGEERDRFGQTSRLIDELSVMGVKFARWF